MKALLLNDYSCVGKCAITVQLPVFAALQVECHAIPTALISTPTFGAENFLFVPLVQEAQEIFTRIARIQERYDAVVVGYLGTTDIAATAERALELPSRLRVVDPSFGDNGEIYHGFSEAYIEEMRRLCLRADLITPNVTEVCALCRLPYCEAPYSDGYLTQLRDALLSNGYPDALITGISSGDETTVMLVSSKEGTRLFHGRRIAGDYHGTGDVFTAAVTSLLIGGASYEEAVPRAMELLFRIVAATEGGDLRFGLRIEEVLSCDRKK